MTLSDSSTLRGGNNAPPQAAASGVDLSPVRRQTARRLRVLCACGHWIEWRDAPLVGFQQDDVERLELRNCPQCGSTRALVIAVTEAA